MCSIRRARSRRIFARLQVLVEDTVGIVGSDEALDGQPHLMAKEGSADITKVSAWNAHNQIVGLALSLHSRIRIEIVECLGQEAGHVDAIGRCQFHVLVQLRIHEGVLDQCLTIVEDTVHLNGGDVLAECCELTLLDG